MNNDTIVAISTPHGVGGIAVVRLSGSRAHDIATQITSATLQPRKAHFAQACIDGQFLDQVVVTLFQAPHSYTGDDVVEIACHGSQYIQERLVSHCIDLGARLANPGEFTLRAFLNGKIDLAQSEAVADLIESTSEVQHRLASNQLRGGFSRQLADIRDQFVQLTALLELELDFSEEEVEFADRSRLTALVAQLHHEISRLVNSFQLGNAIKNGVPVAIVGRPNVGKSTLLNALLNEDRAIVSDIPGTTRDTIEDTLVIDGITFRFIDTAGLRSSTDSIESAGIERSYQSIEKAQVVLLVSDHDHDADLDDIASRVDLHGKTVLKLRNKCDLHSPLPLDPTTLAISAKQRTGIDQLKSRLVEHLHLTPDTTLLTNARHYQAMTHMLQSLDHVAQGLSDNLPADLVVIDIREALYHLGTITGQVSSDEVLGNIFSRFCIGK